MGSLEIPSPPKGSSNSRINKIAPETAIAEAIKARMAVALADARTLKPRKMTILSFVVATCGAFASVER